MSDPYAVPTDEEWAAIEQRFGEAERTFRTVNEAYLATFEPWREAVEAWHAELHEWIRVKALRTPVRDYVAEQLGGPGIHWRRPPTAAKIDPHHRPADVQQVLDDLVDEGKVRRIGRSYEWIKAERLSA